MSEPAYYAALREQKLILKAMQFKCAKCLHIYRKVRKRRVTPKCPECGCKKSSAYWLLWFQTSDGLFHKTDTEESMAAVMGILSAPLPPRNPPRGGKPRLRLVV